MIKKSLVVLVAMFMVLSAARAIPVPKVAIYFFHRGPLSKTGADVEKVTRNAMLTLYPLNVKRGEIFFQCLDLNEKEGAAIAAKYHISGQKLVVIFRENRADLTKKAFKYATDHPEKLSEELKKAVENVGK